MASSAKDIQLRELMDTVSQLKTMMAEQTELIRSLRTVIDEKTAHEAVLQEQVGYLTKKLFGTSSEKTPSDIPGQLNPFNEAEAEQDPSLPEEDCTEEPRPRKKKATQAGHHKLDSHNQLPFSLALWHYISLLRKILNEFSLDTLLATYSN